MFLKPDTVVIIPRAGYQMGDRQFVDALQCQAYIGRTRNNVTHAGKGRAFHLPEVPNMKFDVYRAVTNEVFEFVECSFMVVVV